MTGKIHSYESMATLDGDGVRYAVFLHGCPLRCVYCHNPDAWCGGFSEITAEDLAAKIHRYKPYFADKGGVTFSGGEPLLQADFINETADLLKKDNINYALDTSGSVALNDSVKKCLINSSLVILDLKFFSGADYEKYACGSINCVLSALAFCEQNSLRVWIRTVIVPGLNDTEDDLSKYLEIIKKYTCVEKYELLAFHTMGFSKYERLGLRNYLVSTPPLDADRLKTLQQYVDFNMR